MTSVYAVSFAGSITAAAAGETICELKASTTKAVTLLKALIQPSTNRLRLVRTSTASAAGTVVTPEAPFDILMPLTSTMGAATATWKSFSAVPTAGTVTGMIALLQAALNTVVTLDFGPISDRKDVIGSFATRGIGHTTLAPASTQTIAILSDAAMTAQIISGTLWFAEN